MAKLTLADILSGFVSNVVLNDNNTRIEAAIENTLSRDGTGPNHMNATLDMNGNLIINQANPISVDGFNWEGPWQTGILYKVGDVVERNSSSYICIVEHIAGVFNDDLAAGKWQLVASSADLPSQAGNQGKYLTTDGTTATWGGVISPFAQTLLDDVTAADARNTLGVPSYNSPIFTGTPSAPTPPQFDNSLRIATTEFVQKAGLHYKLDNGGGAIDANTILTSTQAGHWYAVGTLGPPNIEVTLPILSSVKEGITYTFKAIRTFILKASGSDLIYGSATSTYTSLIGETLIVTADLDGWFITTSGFGSGSFRSVKSTVGHLELPNGFILNWGFASTGDDSYTPVIFDKTYTSTVFLASSTPIYNGAITGGDTLSSHVGDVQLSGMNVGVNMVNGFSTNGVYWFALGV